MKYELFLFSRLENGNVLWTCDNCSNTGDVSASKTRIRYIQNVIMSGIVKDYTTIKN